MDNSNPICYTCKIEFYWKMPLVLLKTEKKELMEFYKEKVYCNMKKLFSTKCFKRPKSLKMVTLYSFREKKFI